MKTRIAVLDANSMQRYETMNMIEDYAARRRLNIKSDAFSSGPDLLEASHRYGPYDIYILETDLPDINGFYIARELRARHKHCKIIYYTENKSAALNAFEVEADNYVIKPAGKSKLDSILDRAIESLERDRRYDAIEIKTHTGYIKVPVDDITYVNIVNRALCYHMKDGTCIRTLVLREPFRSAVEELVKDPTFCLAGATMLINLNAVCVISRDAVLFTHGEWLMPPRSAFKSLRTS